MEFPAGVRPWKIKSFTNAHQNFVQPLDEDQSFDLFLDDPELRRLSLLEQYNVCTRNLQWVIGRAMDRLYNIRAVGSGWSLAPVAMSDDVLVNTKNLRLRFTMSAANFRQDYLDAGNLPENHRFLQCGNTMVRINEYLEKDSLPAKSLRASGGSNGQTVVGAFSTGTHGAAFKFGAITEMILGLHIVVDRHRHVYLERASRPVTAPAFHAKIGAEVITDDDLFNAALVSFGSFGIIHGVLLEVEDKFLLEHKLNRIPYGDGLERAVQEADFSGLQAFLKYPHDDADHPLYHFEFAVNLHDFAFDDPERGVFLRVMHKAAYYDDYPRIDMPGEGYTYGDEVLGLMQSVLNTLQSTAGFLNRLLIPGIVKGLFDVAYNRPEDAIGTIGESFANTQFRGKLFSAAFGLRRRDVRRVLEICLQVNERTKLAGAVALRFVKGTEATLGFTRWPASCVLELDGADANINHRFTKNLAERLEDEGIPYTLHWGKINRILTPERVRAMYGEDRLRAWKQQRSRLLSREAQRAFNNAFLEQCGLDDYLPPPAPEEEVIA